MTRPATGLEAPHRRPQRGNPLVEKAVIVGYRVAAWLLWRIPPRLSTVALGLGARLAYLAWPSKRRRSNLNFGHVLGLPPDDPRVRRLALAAYGHYGRYMVELMRLPRQPPAVVDAAIDESALEPMDAIRAAAPGGLIIVVGHVANNEAVAAAAARRGWPLHVVADDSYFPELFALLSAQRESWGVKVIAWRNLRRIYEVLRRGEMLVLPIDWGFRPDGIPVRLFGAWTTLPAGPATLAARTGARIVPVRVHRGPDSTFAVEYGEVITVASASPADLARASQQMAEALEAAVRPAPEQWYSLKPMWPEDPADAAVLEARWNAALAGGSMRRTVATAGQPIAPPAVEAGGRLEAEPS